jgi:tetratricopeptide (TPR) repeat protein
VAGALALGVLPAAAQTPGLPPDYRVPRVFETRVPLQVPRYGKRPFAPLPPPAQGHLERAQALLEAGRLDAAREAMALAEAQAPHHPGCLVVLARLHEARRAWRALEQLARAERALAQDSLLLAHDLVQALRHLGRPREAAQVVLEAWIASPAESEWARTQIDSLASGDPKGVREAVRRAAAALPARPDLTRAAARLEWRLGDGAAALRLLEASDALYRGAPLRWAFAEDLLAAGTARDSAGAIEVLLDLAADRSRDATYRLVAGRRVWEIHGQRGAVKEGAPRVARALRDVPAERWGSPFLIEIMRGLRQAGATAEARDLLKALGHQAQAIPEIALERVLNDLRDGPPERALDALRSLAADSPEAAFLYAEALLFSGRPDSARAWYEAVAHDPAGANAGAALERLYLIEDARPPAALGLIGRLAYEQWRGDERKALALADSLYRSLERGPLWAQAALILARLREATGDGKDALEPLLAVAEGLPDDRNAPRARQRAGDVLRIWYKDEARALRQYEECLARYPKAWNAPEVRRAVETLRRERRF